MQGMYRAEQLPPQRAERWNPQQLPPGVCLNSQLTTLPVTIALPQNIYIIIYTEKFQLIPDSTFILLAQDDHVTRRWLQQLLHNMTMAGMGGAPHGGLDHIMGMWSSETKLAVCNSSYAWSQDSGLVHL